MRQQWRIRTADLSTITDTHMATIGSLSSLGDGERGRAVLAKMLQISPFLRYLDKVSGWQEKSTDFIYRVVQGSLSLQRRALDATVTTTGKVLGETTPETGVQAAVYFQIDIDQTRLADDAKQLVPLGPWIDTQLEEDVEVFTKALESEIFNGSGAGTPRQMSGFKTLLNGTSDVSGFTGNTMVIDAATWATGNHLDLTSSSNDEAFKEKLRTEIRKLDQCTGIMMHPFMYARMATILERQNSLQTTVDQFGMSVERFAGVELIPLLDDTITLTEPNNATTPLTVTTSLYLMSAGENRVSIVTNSGLEFEDYEGLQDRKAGRLRGEIRAEPVIMKPRVIRRVRNIKI